MTTIITNDTIPEVSTEITPVDEATLATIPSGENNTDTPVVADTTPVETVTPIVDSEPVAPIAPVTPEPAPLTSEEHQTQADKAAILASADYHFQTILTKENEIKRLFSEIVKNTERAVNWTYDELKAVYDKVKSEI